MTHHLLPFGKSVVMTRITHSSRRTASSVQFYLTFQSGHLLGFAC
ncbi:hypothetical protein BH23CHL4_BH23CHL4_03360 [soil metagenome]